MSRERISVIGGGLSGCAAALAAAGRKVAVTLHEQRPEHTTSLHTSPHLGELIGRPDLGATRADRAAGLLKDELRALCPALLECAGEVAEGEHSLSVDRRAFADALTQRIQTHELIEVVREEVRAVPDGAVVIATGPATRSPLARELHAAAGALFRFGYIGRPPIIRGVDESAGTWAAPYPGADPVLFIPLTEVQAEEIARLVASAERHTPPELGDDTILADEEDPVERLAESPEELFRRALQGPRGSEQTGPELAISLVPDDRGHSAWHVRRFVTALTPEAQRKVLGTAPGLREVTVQREGLVHRLPWLPGREALLPTLQLRRTPRAVVCGTLSGVAGYSEALVTGALAGLTAASLARGDEPGVPPADSLTGALLREVADVPAEDGRMLRANFGMLPEHPDDDGKPKEERRARQIDAAMTAIHRFAEASV
ncbi:MAG: FAD-dependent oxidoreductase [Armatimonadota bacterium]